MALKEVAGIELANARLSALWQDKNVDVLPLKKNKYVIISDIHLGDGSKSDDFVNNESGLLEALKFYNTKGYTLILLGDIEEFWQFDLQQITDRYDKSIYTSIRGFGDDRVIRIFGNHDSEWGIRRDPAKNSVMSSSTAAEALKMKDVNGRVRILLTHGHQGSNYSDKSSWFSRFFVRLFKQIKPLARLFGLYVHSSATKSQITDDYEQTLYLWAKSQRVMLVCGHTHRAIFASKSYWQRLQEKIDDLKTKLVKMNSQADGVLKDMKQLFFLRRELAAEKRRKRNIDPARKDGRAVPCYFNSGCALFADGLTALELEEDEIRLVKWDNTLEESAVPEIYARGSITGFIDEILQKTAHPDEASAEQM